MWEGKGSAIFTIGGRYSKDLCRLAGPVLSTPPSPVQGHCRLSQGQDQSFAPHNPGKRLWTLIFSSDHHSLRGCHGTAVSGHDMRNPRAVF